MMKRTGLHASQHLAEDAVQATQLALKGGIALFLMVCRKILMRVPRGVHERALLRKQQQRNTKEE